MKLQKTKARRKSERSTINISSLENILWVTIEYNIKKKSLATQLTLKLNTYADT